MDDKKKNYLRPKLEVVSLENNDIITDSLPLNEEAGWNDGDGEDY